MQGGRAIGLVIREPSVHSGNSARGEAAHIPHRKRGQPQAQAHLQREGDAQVAGMRCTAAKHALHIGPNGRSTAQAGACCAPRQASSLRRKRTP